MLSTFSFSFDSPAAIIQAIRPLPPSNAKHNTKSITTRRDLQQELMERSKSVHHPLQSSSFAAPSSEKSNLRNSISTTTTDRADGLSALADLHKEDLAKVLKYRQLTKWDEHTVTKSSLMLPISLPRTSSAQANTNPKQNPLVHPFTSHSNRRNTSNSFSLTVGDGQLTDGRSTEGDQDGLEETTSSTITLSTTSIWKAKDIGSFAGTARQPPVPPTFTQPTLVSVLAPLPINTHVKHITSNFTVVLAVRLFTKYFRPRPQRDLQDRTGANRTADTSPRDTTLTSQLADQFAALALRQRSNWCSFCSQLNTASLVPSAEPERFSFPNTLPAHYALPHASCHHPIAFQSGTANSRQGGDVLKVETTFKRLHCHTFLLCIIFQNTEITPTSSDSEQLPRSSNMNGCVCDCELARLHHTISDRCITKDRRSSILSNVIIASFHNLTAESD
ncbi:hypothetical protein BLNAU_3006 [Blattamonas nauphoetae]|uniref:Uncharacterized protein n=1 Tax=Blattamonas nauphoetae TaxID=2049346 RepID=A0ABQ9YE08_9EUKA|nr:hypothetical protein BLNAU_3006 [Blattamonas nauphoetae]